MNAVEAAVETGCFGVVFAPAARIFDIERGESRHPVSVPQRSVAGDVASLRQEYGQRVTTAVAQPDPGRRAEDDERAFSEPISEEIARARLAR
jgi:hypothetical protein